MAIETKQHTISKSQYVKGLQCPKALWLYRHCKELAQDGPKYADAIQAINARVVDLLEPFKQRWLYYHPNQHSSASIKASLQALA